MNYSWIHTVVSRTSVLLYRLSENDWLSLKTRTLVPELLFPGCLYTSRISINADGDLHLHVMVPIAHHLLHCYSYWRTQHAECMYSKELQDFECIKVKLTIYWIFVVKFNSKVSRPAQQFAPVCTSCTRKQQTGTTLFWLLMFAVCHQASLVQSALVQSSD